MSRVVYECEKENIDFCQNQMHNPDISGFENSVDPDQLASKKPADQDPYCLPISLKLDAYNLDKNLENLGSVVLLIEQGKFDHVAASVVSFNFICNMTIF